MQEDKNLKELLITGGLEKASPAFTKNIMQSIERIKYIHEPLVSNKWIHIYRIIFFTVLGLIVLVTLLAKISSLSFTINLKLPDTYLQYSDTIIIYIIAFWALVFLSQKLGKQPKRYW